MTLLPLTVMAFWIGLYPKPFFDVLEEPVDRLVQQVEKRYVYPDQVADLYPGRIELPPPAEPLKEPLRAGTRPRAGLPPS
jgi:hypothetical protein